MDLNLYLGPNPSSPPRNFAMGSDLSLGLGFMRTNSSDSKEIRAPEPNSIEMETFSSEIPSNIPFQPLFENLIPPSYLAYGSYESANAQWTERSSMLHSLSNDQILEYQHLLPEPVQRDKEYQKSFSDLKRDHFNCFNLTPGETSQQDFFRPSKRPKLRLFESDFGYQNSLIPSVLGGNGGTNLSRSMLDISNSKLSLDLNRTNASAEVLAKNESEKDAEEDNICKINFECKYCFLMAKNPVFNSCGHIFCRSCLYHLLYAQSEHKECPVCKGKLTEYNLIFGMGWLKSDDDNKDKEIFDWGMPIPSRSQSNAVENLMQNLHTISPGIGEGIGNYWGNFPDFSTPIINNFRMVQDCFNHQVSSEKFAPPICSIMPRELREEQWVTEGGRNISEILRAYGVTVPMHEIHDLLNNDHLVSRNCESENAFGRFSENSNICVSTSSVNSPSVNSPNPD